MTTNLIEIFSGTISPLIVRQASDYLDESSDSIGSAVEKIFPALLNAFILKTETDEGTNDMFSFISKNDFNTAVNEHIPSLISGSTETNELINQGSSVLNYLYGQKTTMLVDWVASGNGLRTSSASTLLKLIAALMTGGIAKVLRERSLSAGGLKDLIQSQKPFVSAVTPAAISDLLGVAEIHQPVKIASGSLEGNFNSPGPAEGSTLSKLLPWIVLLIAALGLFYFLEKGGQASEDKQQMVQDSIEQARKLDSIQQQRRTDSLSAILRADTTTTPGDSLSEN